MRVEDTFLRALIFLVQFFVYSQIASHVAQGFLGEGEFLEVILPYVLTAASTGVCLAGNGSNGAIRTSALKGLIWDLKGDLAAGFPEGLGEIMRKKHGIVALAGG